MSLIYTITDLREIIIHIFDVYELATGNLP